MELKQQIRLTQQLVMTPQLQQAIKMLQLSRLELMEVIRQEMIENPALEEVQDIINDEQPEEYDDETISDDAAPQKEVTIEENLNKDIDWSNYIDEYNTPGKISFESEEKDSPNYEAFIANKVSLSEHLLWQFMMTSPTDDEKNIGNLIIGNLNKDGYLELSIDELAQTGGVEAEKVRQVLYLLQTFDPVGVGARDLKECLLIQAKHLGIDDPVVIDIIKNHLSDIEEQNYKAVSRALKIDINEIAVAVDVIRGMEPKPGRRFNDENPQYISADIYVYKTDDDFVIMLNDDGMPRLCINSFYQNTVNRNGDMSDQTKEYMQEKVRSATWLIKSIQQRQKTIYKVMESILKFQREFFEKGVSHLKPMVLKDVALDIDMHESTISRVTNNKYAYTPQGIFELKYFFNTSINRVHGGTVASVSVQQRIKQIVEEENPQKPFSDDKLTEILKEYNINVARRTVAKYREMLKIPPSNKRRKF